jgi:hypothetical protein
MTSLLLASEYSDRASKEFLGIDNQYRIDRLRIRLKAIRVSK